MQDSCIHDWNYCLFILYLFLPWSKIVNTISTFTQNDIDFLRNYYSIITSVSAVFLGIFYYFNKNLIERQNKKKELQRQRLSLLLGALNQYETYIDEILNMKFRDETELKFLRYKVGRSFETVELLIKQNINALNLIEADRSTLLEVNSFVDKSELIHLKYSKIKPQSFDKLKDLYVEKIKEAKSICYIRAE